MIASHIVAGLMLAGAVLSAPQAPVQELAVRFHSAAVAPPDNYSVEVICRPMTGDEVELRYKRQHHTQEGASPDDIDWRGVVRGDWLPEIRRLAQTASLSPAAEKQALGASSLQVRIELEGGKKKEGIPKDTTPWQQFLDAATVVARVEQQREPLPPYRFAVVRPNAEPRVTSIIYDANLRRAHIEHTVGTAGDVGKTYPLSDFEALRSFFSSVTYKGSGALRLPREPGTYVDSGNGHWFELDSSIDDSAKPGVKAELLKKLQKLP